MPSRRDFRSAAFSLLPLFSRLIGLSSQLEMVTLPPGYRIDDSSAATFERHFPRIASTLTSDSRIYWDKFRDAAVLRLQAEQSFRCVCLVYDGEEGEELAGWVRVVSDGIR